MLATTPDSRSCIGGLRKSRKILAPPIKLFLACQVRAEEHGCDLFQVLVVKDFVAGISEAASRLTRCRLKSPRRMDRGTQGPRTQRASMQITAVSLSSFRSRKVWWPETRSSLHQGRPSGGKDPTTFSESLRKDSTSRSPRAVRPYGLYSKREQHKDSPISAKLD